MKRRHFRSGLLCRIVADFSLAPKNILDKSPTPSSCGTNQSHPECTQILTLDKIPLNPEEENVSTATGRSDPSGFIGSARMPFVHLRKPAFESVTVLGSRCEMRRDVPQPRRGGGVNKPQMGDLTSFTHTGGGAGGVVLGWALRPQPRGKRSCHRRRLGAGGRFADVCLVP